MNFKKFVFYSFVGSFPWTLALAYVGYALGPSWEDIMDTFEKFDILVVAGLIIIAVWYFKKFRDNNRKQPDENAAEAGQP